MRAEVALCTEWSSEKRDWPAKKKRFLLNMISRKKRVCDAQNERRRT